MRTIAELWLLWGKTGGDGTWHPALAHILDVGAVAEILTRHFARRLAELLSLDEEVAARLAAFLIASHDIGKLFAGFQHKNNPIRGLDLATGFAPCAGDQERRVRPWPGVSDRPGALAISQARGRPEGSCPRSSPGPLCRCPSRVVPLRG